MTEPYLDFEHAVTSLCEAIGKPLGERGISCLAATLDEAMRGASALTSEFAARMVETVGAQVSPSELADAIRRLKIEAPLGGETP